MNEVKQHLENRARQMIIEAGYAESRAIEASQDAENQKQQAVRYRKLADRFAQLAAEQPEDL